MNVSTNRAARVPLLMSAAATLALLAGTLSTTQASAATYTTDVLRSADTITQTLSLDGGAVPHTDAEYRDYTVSRRYNLQGFDNSRGTLTGASLHWSYTRAVSAFTEFRNVRCLDASLRSDGRDCRNIDLRNNAGKGDKDVAKGQLQLSVLGTDSKRTLGTPQVVRDGEYDFNPENPDVGAVQHPSFMWGDFTTWSNPGSQVLTDLDSLTRNSRIDLTLTAKLFDSGGWIDCDASIGSFVRECVADVKTRLFWDIDFWIEYEYAEIPDDDDDDDLSAVPLPASGWLLLAGLGALAGRRAKNRAS
ncbi:VPLPA-CTERM sorting domain-containing protein [uncultured Roseobacter sp.]|uniref:VPLPA-CTERM sorting domain-containing protein n=1 Tax=uncultured Roseobacter sp. TaxID=114847 RepID=UPI0026387386|nr:VPLPA-CTERM sorting domain-containing protein [uncultured Roseobacter sp.]